MSAMLRSLRRPVAIAIMAVLTLSGCGEWRAPIGEPPFPHTWVEFSGAGGRISFREDGTGTVLDFPFSEPGESCDPSGETRVSGEFIWTQDSEGVVWIDLNGHEILMQPSYARFAPDWEMIKIAICYDGTEAPHLISFVG